MELNKQEIFQEKQLTLSRRIYEQLEYGKGASLKDIVAQVNIPVSVGVVPEFIYKLKERYYRERSTDLIDAEYALRKPEDITTFKQLSDETWDAAKNLPQVFLT